jgi:glycosyltransferase involved in cell wall biosynthesis
MKVAACLIVKNEGLVLARCLDSLRGLVQAVVIVDTGSTDDTLDVIRGLNYPVPIHLHQKPWVNFAHNRTELLRLASPAADYLLLLDADYTVEGRLPELTADANYLLVRTPSIEYPKLVLVRSALPWRYEGVVHEYLVCEQAGPTPFLDTLIIRDHVDGGRRPPGWQPRWEWDAAVLEQELARDPSNTRNVFYLARSYDDLAATRPGDSRAGEWRRKALARHRERSQMTAGYADEAFYSLLRLGVMRLGEGDGLTDLLEAWQRCPHRWEPVHEAVRWLNERLLFEASYALSTRALAKPAAPSGLFIHRAVYDHLLLFEHSISAYWLGYYQECWDACQTLLGKQLPGHLEELVRRNMAFARQRLDEQAKAPGSRP